jgi:two-component system, response regulator PdtaR
MNAAADSLGTGPLASSSGAGARGVPHPVLGGLSSKGRILVLDDDRMVLALLTHGLTQAGYEVIGADNGDDAILLAREQRPHLALLDIRMQGKNGFEVAATLRDAYRIPFVFLSGFSDDATVAEVKRLGALAYWVKPLEVAQIVPSVEAAFARLRSTSEPAASAAAPRELLADAVPMAVGLLMHRYSLKRAVAWSRLQKLATEQGITPAVQAERLLAAVEELARSAG